MRRASVRAVLAGALVGGLLGLGVTAAFAAVSSGPKYFTTNHVGYGNSAFGDVLDQAGTYLDRQDHGSADPGKMGARGRVYWDGGTLCNASVWRYNTQSTTHFEVSFDHDCGGWVFSRGVTHTWNGNGYETVDTLRTPNWYG
jgi:hypothetical protein